MSLTGGFLIKKYRLFFCASMFGWIISTMNGLVDSVFAGLFVSEEAVSAIELVSPIYSIVMFMCLFAVIGTSTLFSRYAGAFEKEKSYAVAGMGMALAVIIGIISAILMICLKDVYFEFYSSSAEIEAYARQYYEALIIYAFLNPIYWWAYYLVGADGDAQICAGADGVYAFGNLGCSLIFVRRFGLFGIALGTVVSLVLSFLVIMAHFFSKRNSIRVSLHFSFSELFEMFKLGSTASFIYLYEAIVNIVLNKYVIVVFGDIYLPAFMIVNIMISFAGCFICGIDSAMPFINVCYGENNPVGLKRIMKYANRYTIALGLGFTAAAFLLAGFIPQIYGISNQAVYEASVYAARGIGLAYIFFSFEFEFSTYYIRTGKELLANIMTACNGLLFPLLFVVPLSSVFGFRGLVWGFSLAPAASLLTAFVIIAFKYGVREIPFIPIRSDSVITVYELKLCPEEIAELQKIIRGDLKSEGVGEALIERILLILEETFMVVSEKNTGKNVLADCTLMINDNDITLITRDNGMIFDITDPDIPVHSFREYVTSRLMTGSQKNSYLTTTSFNRNSYTWKR